MFLAEPFLHDLLHCFALLVWRLDGVRLSQREWAGVGLAVSGLGLLAVSLAGGGTTHPFAAHASWQGVAAWMAATGIVAGLLGAVALTRVMASLLFGVSALDGFTFASVALILAVVALAATIIPASRVTRVDPAVALRQD